MKDIKELEEKIVFNMCQAIKATQPFNTDVNKDNDITNFNIGYLQGLARCIELMNEPEVALGTCEPEYPLYTMNEPVLYQNGDKFELGIIKSVCGNDEYFVWYHTGDTAARTHARHLHKISNNYAFRIYKLDTEGKEIR